MNLNTEALQPIARYTYDKNWNRTGKKVTYGYSPNGLNFNRIRPGGRLGFLVTFTYFCKAHNRPVTAREFFSAYMAYNKIPGGYRKGYGSAFLGAILKSGLFKVAGKGNSGEYHYDFGPAMTDEVYEKLGLISLSPNYSA